MTRKERRRGREDDDAHAQAKADVGSRRHRQDRPPGGGAADGAWRAERVGSRSGEPPFDWEDQATWAPALQGVGSVYVTYYPDLAVPGAVETVGCSPSWP